MSNIKDPQENTNHTNHTLELVLLSLAALFFAVIGIAQLVVFASGHEF
jgi:hypothetical protein